MIATALVIVVLGQSAPDPELTPGSSDPTVTQETVQQTICRHGYTKSVRHVTESEKRRVIAAYLAKHPEWPHCGPLGKDACEYDHRVSLELGGSNEPDNLWPQPYCPLPRQTACYGAREKDVVETEFHRLICAGALSLAEARARILKDWVAEYLTLVR